MQVIATAVGFFGSRRKVGDVFDVPEGTTGTWFKPHEGEAPAPIVNTRAEAKAAAKAASAKADTKPPAAHKASEAKYAGTGADLA